MQNIDELVATHVMGWKKEQTGKLIEWFKYYGEKRYNISYQVSIFHPSTNIADAWTVVEKMNDHGYNVCLNTAHETCGGVRRGEAKSGDLHCNFFKRNDDVWTSNSVYADTAPLAISLAALKAIGVDVYG